MKDEEHELQEAQELEEPMGPLSDKAPLTQDDSPDGLALPLALGSTRRGIAIGFSIGIFGSVLLWLASSGVSNTGAGVPSGVAAAVNSVGFSPDGTRIVTPKIPARRLAGGGQIPMMMMGGDEFREWFKAAGRGAGIQNFLSYGNGPKIAPQLKAYGRENVFMSSGIPCGCCGYDAPKIQPMNATLAAHYIDSVLAQLDTSYVDLLLFHHRCKTDEETAAVWSAFEEAKRAGKARHIGVSNFNAHDLATLLPSTTEPIEVLEAHFGVGLMDFETLAFARAHGIHPLAFASLSERTTDHPTLKAAVDAVAAAHGINSVQAMYAYVYNHNLTVLSSCFSEPAKCARYYVDDLAVFDVKLSADEMRALDAVTTGKRTCTDCFTDECQACARALDGLGCPLGQAPGQPSVFPVWGRGNKDGSKCIECAYLPEHADAVRAACGNTDRGESMETMVPKACGV